MKKLFILIILCHLFNNENSYSQIYIKSLDKNIPIIITASNAKVNEKIQLELKKRPEVIESQVVDLKIENIVNERIEISIFEHKSIVLNRKKYTFRSSSDFSFLAESENKLSSFSMSLKNTDIIILIHIELSVYIIEKLEDQFILMKINQNNYPKDHPNYDSNGENDNIINDNKKNENKYENLKSENSILKKSNQNDFKANSIMSSNDTECKLRILALYTTAAKNARGGKNAIENTIQLSIDAMNTALTNSLINYQTELVYMEETSYAEQGFFTDVKNFQIKDDGYLENVHQLKEQFAADICVLIVDESDYCGLSRAIKSCINYSFCVVNWDCAVGYYSLAHEIGHLIGCRHNQNIDNAIVPYGYGHGYCYGSAWRDIMSYYCSQGDGTRIQYFSNPNVNYNGVPTGTLATNDNARVFNENILNYMSHRPSTSKRDIIQSDVVSNIGSLHFPILNSQGAVEISSDKSWNFEATNTIYLNNGFKAISGSSFLAKIVPMCGFIDNDCNYNLSPDKYPYKNFNNNEFNITPNPINSKFSITISDLVLGEVVVVITDILGNVLQNSKFQKINNILKIDIDISGYLTGVYMIKTKLNEIDLPIKKVIKL